MQANTIALANIDDLKALVKSWSNARDTLATLGAKHSAIQGSIDDLHRHLVVTPLIADALNVFVRESESLLKRIRDEDVEYKRLVSVVDEKYTELRSALKVGLDLLRYIDKVRTPPKDEVDLSVIDLVDATSVSVTKCPYHELRASPSITGSGEVRVGLEPEPSQAHYSGVKMSELFKAKV